MLCPGGGRPSLGTKAVAAHLVYKMHGGASVGDARRKVMSVSIEFGARDPANRKKASTGIVRDKTPSGYVFRVMNPYIKENFQTLQAAEEARKRVTGRESDEPLRRGPAPKNVQDRYISRIRGDKFRVAIQRLKFNKFVNTREAAEEARRKALTAAGAIKELYEIEGYPVPSLEYGLDRDQGSSGTEKISAEDGRTSPSFERDPVLIWMPHDDEDHHVGLLKSATHGDSSGLVGALVSKLQLR